MEWSPCNFLAYVRALRRGCAASALAAMRQEAACCLLVPARVRCHRVGGMGSRMGPDLSDVGSRMPPSDVLAILLHPDERVLPSQWHVRAVSKDGDNHR